ncbi:hypothetical protein C8Q76DRAFT_759719 [Earliella scabrosa]|nr:hypothetical protein C8Q76DRAFT_759719 [Earliella scabrosa]
MSGSMTMTAVQANNAVIAGRRAPRLPISPKPPKASPFLTQVNTSTRLAREIRHTLVDEQLQLARIEDKSESTLVPRLSEALQTFERLIYAAESAAVRLSTTINSYVTLHKHLGDSRAVSDMTDEFVALLKHISSLRYNPDGEFLSLILALEKLGSDMNAALGEGDARRQQQVKDAKSEVTRLEEQLDALHTPRMKKGTRAPRDGQRNFILALFASLLSLWRLSGKAKSQSAAVAELSRKLETAKTTLTVVQTQFNACSVEALVASTRGVQRKLEDLRGLLKAILTDVADKLEAEMRTYVGAAQRCKSQATRENQLALRSAAKRISSSSATWKERALILRDSFAKASK